MIMLVLVFYITQYSLHLLLLTPNASKFGMQLQEPYKVFSEIFLQRILLVSVLTKEIENFSLETLKAKCSQ